jgi:predicted MFS family arabinose efflux permease
MAFGMALFVKEDFKPAVHRKGRHWLPASIIPPGLAIGFVNVHYPVITGFLILHLAQHGDGGRAAFTTYALTILLSRFFLGSLPDKIPASITFNGGLVGMAVGLLLLASGPRPFMAVVAAAILGFGFSFPWASVASTVLKRSPVAEHGSTIGFLSAFYDLFVGVSSFTAGAVADRFGYSAAFVMAAISLIAAAVAARFVFIKDEGEMSNAANQGVEQQALDLVDEPAS